MQKLTIYSDGGSRGNPGPAAIGVVIEGQTEISKCIGIATNNQAEYTAVIEALKWVSNHLTATSEVAVEVEFFLDSQLVVEQLNGRYKLKNEGLKPLFWEVRELTLKLGGKVTFQHISREQNKEADRLVNEALDKQDNPMIR